MSDSSNPKKGSIPDWQQQEAPEAPEISKSDPKSPKVTHDTEARPPRAALLEQASRFLKEDEIKDAPTERKFAFLQSKGLTNNETSQLLDPSLGNASTTSEKEEDATEQPSDTPSLPPSQAEPASPQPSSPPTPAKDITPIITYPEFLIHSRKPPPLITTSRLINTFYIFSAAAATVYGTSKYIAEPMLESLTSARHSLFESAQTKLDTLNEKLEKTVSVNPSDIGAANQSNSHEKDDESETAEDMAPLFNRTVGTQTSPLHSHSLSSSTSSSIASSPSPQQDTTTAQQSSLRSLHTTLSSLLPHQDTKPNQTDAISALVELKQYLDTLTYSHLYRSESKDDAIAKFRAEIRGVKGMLLSARSFPAGPGRGGALGTGYER
ncbi:MAG: hypothetical protein Q9218_004955 [Villophora microphyllina]